MSEIFLMKHYWLTEGADLRLTTHQVCTNINWLYFCLNFENRTYNI